MRYTTVNLYQYVPTTYNQLVLITCNQHVPVIILYQKIPIGMRLVYVVDHVRMWHVYIVDCVCVWPIYNAACVHLHKDRFFTLLKLIHFIASITSTCNLSLCPICSCSLCIHHHTYPLTKFIYISVVVCHTCVYNHDQV